MHKGLDYYFEGHHFKLNPATINKGYLMDALLLRVVAEEACLPKCFDQIWLAMEGDWGGQHYLTVPIKHLTKHTSRKAITRTLNIMDKIAWDCNKGDGCSFCFMLFDNCSSPMFGPEFIDGLWIHEEFKDIRKVIVDGLCLPKNIFIQIGDGSVNK